jgi:hypothetical protein
MVAIVHTAMSRRALVSLGRRLVITESHMYRPWLVGIAHGAFRKVTSCVPFDPPSFGIIPSLSELIYV